MKISILLVLSLFLVAMLAMTSAAEDGTGRKVAKGHRHRPSSGGKRGHHTGGVGGRKRGHKNKKQQRSRRAAVEGADEAAHLVVKKERDNIIDVDDMYLSNPRKSLPDLDTSATFWPFTSSWYAHPRVYTYGRPYYSSGRPYYTSGGGIYGTRRRGWWPAGMANIG